MRTLKKSLCLVLALVFVLGLCTIGASAYTDDAQVEYDSAVTVLTGLEIIDGYEDGSFKPSANVTRAEAAAMITRMMLGRGNADKLPETSATKFSDVSGWYAKYVSFCASRGIIVGTTDTTFEPNGLVTGTQLATMLLRALGYGKMGEYEGAGWDVNAVSDALTYGLLDDSQAADFAAPATREECALYVFNTLDVTEVKYDVDLNVYEDRSVGVGVFAVPMTFGDQIFQLADATVQLTENQATGAAYTIIGGTNYAVETGLDLIAHEVKVYYKNVAKQDKDGNNYFEAYIVEDNSKLLDKGSYYGDMYKALVAANKANDGLNPDAIPVWTNYSPITTTLATGLGTFAALKGDYVTGVSHSALDYDIILSGDGTPIAIMDSEFALGKVTNIVDGEITLTPDYYGGDYTVDNAYEGIAKNDYVVVRPVGDIYYIEATSTKTVDIIETSAFGYNYAFFGGLMASSAVNQAAVTVTGSDTTAIAVGDSVLFYVDPDGGYFSYKILEKGADAGLVFIVDKWQVTGAGTYGNTTTSYVQCVDAAGEEVIYPVDATVYAGVTLNTVQSVRVNSKGYATFTAAGKVIAKTSAASSLAADGGTYYVTADTKVIYVSGSKSTLDVSVASNLSGITTGTNLFVGASATGNTGVTYNADVIWLVGTPTVTTAAGSYIYVNFTDWSSFGMGIMPFTSASGYTDVYGDGTTVPYFSLYIDGEQNYSANVTADGTIVYNISGSDFINQGLYEYSTDEAGVYTLAAVNPQTATSGTKQIATTLTAGMLNGGKLYISSTQDATAVADGVAISAKVVNVSGATNTAGTRYLTLDTLDDIQAILDNGGSVDIMYMATLSSGSWRPVGTIYVVGATE